MDPASLVTDTDRVGSAEIASLKAPLEREYAAPPDSARGADRDPTSVAQAVVIAKSAAADADEMASPSIPFKSFVVKTCIARRIPLS